jgi:putative heme-binding domain-containing protein
VILDEGLEARDRFVESGYEGERFRHKEWCFNRKGEALKEKASKKRFEKKTRRGGLVLRQTSSMKTLCRWVIFFVCSSGGWVFSAEVALDGNKATPPSRIKVAKGFKVELLYSVPSAEQGSWINLCVDDKGRIITSDQFGGLYRFAPPPPGQELDSSTVVKIPAPIKAGDGLLWAFGALYVGVNDYENANNSGLYRVWDSDGDDQLDKVEKLRDITARGDHGVHAVVLAPDGKSIFLVCGNGAKALATDTASVPRIFGEDHLLPRMPDGRGFMREVLAPGGSIYRVSPDGKKWDLYASGFRNIFDAAFNRDGELFTWDADMEWDFNTPWYRPTRVCHVVSGAEFGWRNGAGKRPEWYPDNLPPVINVGPGSPTGVTFGYGAKFPAKYQESMFILDWSWGKLYALEMQPRGSSYTAVKEEILSGTPLPISDAVIHATDGAMYLTTGGRKVQSGLYRLTYVGSESTAPVVAKVVPPEARSLRHRLEAFHLDPRLEGVEVAWPELANKDRFIRWAARTALEHQPLGRWAEKALGEKNPSIQVEALLGLARAGGIDPQHRQENDPPNDKMLGERILKALSQLEWTKLTEEERITLVRTMEIVCVRFGAPEPSMAAKLAKELDGQFPASSREMNWLLCETLVYLQSPSVAAKAMALIDRAPTQEEQVEYARSLRMLKVGWTMELRTRYFEWFIRAANFRGGASFAKSIELIRNGALATLTAEEKSGLAAVLGRKPEVKTALQAAASALAGRTEVKAWTMEELSGAASAGMKGRNFETGRKMFGAVGCFSCHRFGNEGGMTGPDLTGAGGRYSPHDLLDSIINPSKEINEQFVPTVVTKMDGSVVIGTIVNLYKQNITINTDPADPGQIEEISRANIQGIEPSKVSLMPPGLLSLLTKEEILDLLAYVLSGGDEKSLMFKN